MIGLSSKQANSRLKKYGYNELKTKNKLSILKIFFRQYTDIFSLLLIASAFLSLILKVFGYGESYIDFVLIIAILLINGIIGTVQEYKAEKTLEKLKDMQKTFVLVYRDNKLISLDSKYLVPGDVIILQEGDKVSADCVVLDGNLTVDESSFTGESYPIIKNKNDKVYAGTFVVNGKATLKVENTAHNTKFGMLVNKVATIEDISFFKTQLNTFTNKLMRYILLIVFLFFVVGFLKSHSFTNMLLAAVALGVAVVPEGLAATTVITMMNGIKRLVEKKVLVKRIDAIEVLGAVEYLISDKTGTLTEGKLKVYSIKGHGGLSKLSYYALPDSKDPVDLAILDYAEKPKGKLLNVKPFNYETRTSSVVWEIDGKKVEYIKGAPESIFKLTGRVLDISKYLENGLRVLALAKKESNSYKLEGVIAFEDPIRRDAKLAINVMKEAGIRPILITGDHEKTARYVAEKLALPKIFLSGDELLHLDEKEIYFKLKDGGIVYRALPEIKLKLVEVFKDKGKVVAATGDGVNDVLLLKKADVGIAMGKRGTDVAKEASDIILLDDSLSTIIRGIIEGRGIIQNVRKFIAYLLTCNVGEAVSNLLFPFFYHKIPLDAPKLLWINLITDGFPAVSFGLDKVDDKIIKKDPVFFRFLLTKKIRDMMNYLGIYTGVALALLFYISLKFFGFKEAATIVFFVVVLSEFLRIILVRMLFDEKIIQNKYMMYAVLISFILQIIVIYSPLNKFFNLIPITGYALLLTIIYSIAMFFINLLLTLHIKRVH